MAAIGDEMPLLRGGVRIGFRDIAAFRLRLWRPYWIWGLPLFLISVGLFVASPLLSIPPPIPFISAIGVLGGVLGGLLGPLVIGWLNRIVMGRDRFTSEYEVDDQQIRARDALGVEIVVPWSNVRRVIFTKRLLIFQLKPRLWLFLPLRAFRPEEQQILISFAARTGR